MGGTENPCGVGGGSIVGGGNGAGGGLMSGEGGGIGTGLRSSGLRPKRGSALAPTIVEVSSNIPPTDLITKKYMYIILKYQRSGQGAVYDQ